MLDCRSNCLAKNSRNRSCNMIGNPPDALAERDDGDNKDRT